MKFKNIKRATNVMSALLAAVVMLAPATAFGQTYPARRIALICPYGPGTGIDIIARELAQRLTPVLGQPVVVENKPGAAGTIATDMVGQAPPDGYTILITSTSGIISQITNRARTDLSKLEPIAFAGTLAYALAVPATFSARSISELVTIAKGRPGQLHYVGFVGGVPQFLGEMLNSSAGTDIVMVPYKSTTDAQVDVLSGRVQVWFTTVPSTLPLVKANRIRVLGVTAEKRVDVLPDVPTMKEAGYPELNVDVAFFLMAPAGTPKAIVSKLNAEVGKILNSREMQERLATQGVEPKIGGVDEVGRYVKEELARWDKIIKASPTAKQ